MADNDTQTVAIALGSNIGDRLQAMRSAVMALAPYMTVKAKSRVYETAPMYVGDQPVFLNAAILGETKLQPMALLRAVKNLEAELGRQPTYHYGPRAIDIDLIFYGNETVNLSELILPHARLAEREFVLRPLNDIAPGWKHPASGRTVAEMLSERTEQSPVLEGSL